MIASGRAACENLERSDLSRRIGKPVHQEDLRGQPADHDDEASLAERGGKWDGIHTSARPGRHGEQVPIGGRLAQHLLHAP